MKGFDYGENEDGKESIGKIITERRPIIVKTEPRKHCELGGNYIRRRCVIKRANKPRPNFAPKTSRACRTAEGFKVLKLCRSLRPAEYAVSCEKDLKSTRLSAFDYWTQEVT